MSLAAFNKLCDTCNRTIEKISRPDWHSNVAHHRSLATLRESAEHGCGICTTLFEHLQTHTFQQLPNLWEIVFPIECESDTSSAIWQHSFELIFSSDRLGDLNLKFILEAIDAVGDKESTYIPSSTTDSPESWELIGRWMKQCTKNHVRCNAKVPEPWAPTRLLDIGTDEDHIIRLVERDEKNLFFGEPYATLSHCWGRLPMVMTRKGNILEHRKGIKTENFSVTFRDAIRIARGLKLRYLWIDTLCIVQDSNEDWVTEADMMSEVYRYAYVNISATGAMDGSGGCFWTRDPRNVRPTEFNVHWGNGPDKVRRYCVVPEPKVWARNIIDQPLNRRGWVLQERILSPRVLQFGYDQLFWECRESVACETYHRGLPLSLRGNTVIDIKSLDLSDEPKDERWPTKYISTSQDSSASQTLWGKIWNTLMHSFTSPITVHEVTLNSTRKSASVYRDWDAVVELYSLGELTFAKDKLVALSGLASAISIGEQSSLNDGYLAGLWHSSLPSHLLWTTEIREQVRKEISSPDSQEALLSKKPKRYTEYIAPSWSWACIDGKISFTWCLHNYDSRDYLVTLEGAEVIWSHGGARFGQVTSGFLKLSGPLASVLWKPYKIATSLYPGTASMTHIFPRNFNPKEPILISSEDWDIKNQQTIIFDTINDIESDIPEELILLPVIGVIKRTAHENETVAGLVLRPEVKANEYSRVGFFYTTMPRVSRILRNMPRQTITII